MRIRTIKPEFWDDEDFAEISEPALLLAIGLLNYSDDEGYFRANEKLIQSAIFPLRELSSSIRRCLDDLSSIRFILLATGLDGHEYGLIRNFTKHQKIDRPKPSIIKPLVNFDDQSTINRRSIDDQSTINRSARASGREQGTGNREQGTERASKSRDDDRAEIFNSKFWPAYPKHVGKDVALKSWLKLKPDDALVERILTAVSIQRQCDQWQRDGGQFIPHPSTWLNQRRWEDEIQRGENGVLCPATAKREGSKGQEQGVGGKNGVGGAKQALAPTIEYPAPSAKARVGAVHWQAVLEKLATIIDDESYNTWIAGLTCEAMGVCGVWLQAPSLFIRNWVLNNYQDQILSCCAEFIGVKEIDNLYVDVVEDNIQNEF